MLRARELVWEGCLNVRDLGGFRTEDGGETRFGAVVRADSPAKLTESGWEAATAYGVRRIVDLRFHDELADDPPRTLPLETVHVPLFGDPSPERWRELNELAAAAPDELGSTRAVYLSLLTALPENFARAVAATAVDEGTVLVHCVAGKDRTGLVAALLLRLAGVPIADIDDDYALSGDNLRDWFAPWIDAAPDATERERRRRICATPAGTMAEVLDELERRHGSVAGFLRAGGASDAALAGARARLRG